MERKIVCGMMLTLLLIGMLTLAFNIQPAKSDWTWTETIYIRADGGVDPDTAPISSVDNITYTLTDNIVGDVPQDSNAIVVERDNIVVDGAGYIVEDTGALSSRCIYLHERGNVTIKNMEVKTFDFGIFLNLSNCNSIQENKITNNGLGILMIESSNNTIYQNNFIDNTVHVYPYLLSVNIWDDDYPSGGNYWSDYADVDSYSGPYQNLTGSDGIWDHPYVIDGNNKDNYPLVNPWTPPTPVGGISIPVNKLELLAPYIGLTILLAVAVATIVYVKKRKRHAEIVS